MSIFGCTKWKHLIVIGCKTKRIKYRSPFKQFKLLNLFKQLNNKNETLD